ncbi:AI-2E family transporter [Candidatus Nitronereus thalassa]|uniref:AI-2E family transporter n=1 Tax=Candidatus Nitronereus thalassa TaxID=3020898 RepID=A0ABU3KB66_9BACT|nr:AI-2E family transporter [Candidatus Nitronereus thalassa]MDT7043730.1 AI-2E family transporter [Candidatus Nitronereus thalassa]
MSQPSHPSPADRHLWQIAFIRDLLWLSLILLLLWLGYYLRSIFVPVLIGAVFAYLFTPLITFANQQWKWPRPFTTLLLVIFLLLLIGGGMIILGPIIVDQAVTLTSKLPDYANWLADRYGLQHDTLMSQLQQLAVHVQENPFETFQSVFSGTSRAFDFMGSLIGTATYILISFALIPIYFFFFAWQFPTILASLQEYIPARYMRRTKNIAAQMDEAVGSFFRGRLLIALIMAIMFSVGWYLADVPYWFLLGVGTGVLSLIPYAATFGWPIAVLVKYLDMTTTQGLSSVDWMAVAFWPSLVYAVVQILEGWVLTPWIQSQSTDLHAVTILLVVLIGGAVAGVYGLILAIPLTACLKILTKEMVLPKMKGMADKSSPG